MGEHFSLNDSIETKQQLIDYFFSGCKKNKYFKIGTEYEGFLFYKNTLNRLKYEGNRGIKDLLEGLIKTFSWDPCYEGNKITSLKKNGAFITLEPGGQIELSGDALDTLHDTKEEVQGYFHDLFQVQNMLGIRWLGMGADPFTRIQERPWFLKDRYRVMQQYMPQKGSLGLEMMTGTATIQSNLDFSSEADMARKLKVSINFQPIITALFACSPFSKGKLNGFQSYRSYIWENTDPERCGWLPWVFEGDMTFEKYVDYLLDVPMYFIQKKNTFGDVKTIPALGQSFRDFIARKLPAAPGVTPTIKDWENHLSCVFPDVRLKTFLEMRGADSGPFYHATALSALWVGLLYDENNLRALESMTKNWTNEDRYYLYKIAPKEGLNTSFFKQPLYVLAKEILNMASQGLKNRKNLNKLNQDESIYLEPLFEYVEKKKNLAQQMVDAYSISDHKRVESIIEFLNN